MILSNHSFEWLDTLPQEWKIDKVKNHFYFSDVQTDKFDSYPVLSLTMTGVKERKVDTNEGQLPESYEKYNLVDPLCLIFNPMDLISGWVDVPKTEGLISPSYRTIKLRSEGTNLHFMKYYFQSLYKEKVLFHFGEGVHYEYRWGLGKETLKNFPIPNPPKEEQNKIVNYLDQKTYQIDKLIEKIELKIKFLKEQKNLLINELVTKGLNSNLEMKDSGVDWIGEIPRHWEIKKLKYLVEHIKEKRTPNENDKKISPEYVESDTGICINFFSEHSGDGYKFIPGDILLNKLRIYLKKVLRVDFDGYSIGEMIVLRTEQKNLSEFIFNSFFSDVLIGYLNSLSTGVKVPRVSPDGILSTKFPLPPINEIIKINEFIKHSNSKIYKKVSTEKKRIKLLKEYKQSLISEVVTGKKKVVS